MHRYEEINILLRDRYRRVRSLRKKQAFYGVNSPTSIELEIEDLQSEIDALEAEKNAIAPGFPKSSDHPDQIFFIGKPGVGKSSIIRALTHVELTTAATAHVLAQGREWIEVPLSSFISEKIAQAAIIVFVIDGEPFYREVDVFDQIHEYTPLTPKIIFVNKWDIVEQSLAKAERHDLQERLWQRMNKYLKSREDIIYGSAYIYIPIIDSMQPQVLPNLMQHIEGYL